MQSNEWELEFPNIDRQKKNIWYLIVEELSNIHFSGLKTYTEIYFANA